MEGGWVRRILPITIPVALIVGVGVNYLVSHKPWPSWVGIVTYTFTTSMIIFYLWFVKLDVSKWWVRNLQSLTTNHARANYPEFLIYATPWLFLLLIIVASKRCIHFRFRSIGRISSRRLTYLVGLILILVSVIGPVTILSQVLKYPVKWDPAYYDEIDSIKPHGLHWHIPTIDLYRSQLSDDESITIGFGVNLFQYSLKRSFIDLNHPRNWLIYLPLLQSISTEELLSYLEKLNARYFLIPTKTHGARFRYESVLKNSTLFKQIATYSVITGSDGKMFKFERLGRLWIFDLYALTPL